MVTPGMNVCLAYRTRHNGSQKDPGPWGLCKSVVFAIFFPATLSFANEAGMALAPLSVVGSVAARLGPTFPSTGTGANALRLRD